MTPAVVRTRWWQVGVAFLVLAAAASAAVEPGSSRALATPSSTVVSSVRELSSSGVVPADGAVTIYAYKRVSIVEGSAGVVAVPLDAVKSRAILAVLNRLPRAPSGRCMENALVYRLTVRVPGQRTLTDVVGWACDATVSLTVGSSPRPTLNDTSCALVHAVISDLPPNEADGTRHAVVGCRDK